MWRKYCDENARGVGYAYTRKDAEATPEPVGAADA
jgi:hypothetical protein